jgi:hypothetical protein
VLVLFSALVRLLIFSNLEVISFSSLEVLFGGVVNLSNLEVLIYFLIWME